MGSSKTCGVLKGWGLRVAEQLSAHFCSGKILEHMRARLWVPRPRGFYCTFPYLSQCLAVVHSSLTSHRFSRCLFWQIFARPKHLFSQGKTSNKNQRKICSNDLCKSLSSRDLGKNHRTKKISPPKLSAKIWCRWDWNQRNQDV